jgi:hypothetical protein
MTDVNYKILELIINFVSQTEISGLAASSRDWLTSEYPNEAKVLHFRVLMSQYSSSPFKLLNCIW